jgi:NAD(P)-dependent dehydrogenase (short-subunit alcohol dehydrogenase family)
VADAGRRLDVVAERANAAAINVARIGEVTQEHLQKALPLLNDGGSIILNPADPDVEGDGGGAYAAIMAALQSLAPTWTSELRDRKIRVSVISPDATETAGINALAGMLRPGSDAAGELGNYPRGIVPPARRATAQTIADTALLLAAGLTGLPQGSAWSRVAARSRDRQIKVSYRTDRADSPPARSIGASGGPVQAQDEPALKVYTSGLADS